MSYSIVTETTYQCPKGHKFENQSSRNYDEVLCIVCYNEFIGANVPKAKKISKPKPLEPVIELQSDNGSQLLGASAGKALPQPESDPFAWSRKK